MNWINKINKNPITLNTIPKKIVYWCGYIFVFFLTIGIIKLAKGTIFFYLKKIKGGNK